MNMAYNILYRIRCVLKRGESLRYITESHLAGQHLTNTQFADTRHPVGQLPFGTLIFIQSGNLIKKKISYFVIIFLFYPINPSVYSFDNVFMWQDKVFQITALFNTRWWYLSLWAVAPSENIFVGFLWALVREKLIQKFELAKININ